MSELPQAAGVDADLGYQGGVMEISSPLSIWTVPSALALRGIPAENAHIELCIPTVHDPSLAPEGKHIVTIDVNSQPYRLAADQGGWDDIREAVADRAIAQLATYFPNLLGSIEHRQVLSPLDMERLLGISGGHPLHGDMGSDQLFALRPVPGFGGYRTPVKGLYLCGAGTHPGGGVTGANGRNCAREVLRDVPQGPPFGGRAAHGASGFEPVQPPQVVGRSRPSGRSQEAAARSAPRPGRGRPTR